MAIANRKIASLQQELDILRHLKLDFERAVAEEVRRRLNGTADLIRMKLEAEV